MEVTMSTDNPHQPNGSLPELRRYALVVVVEAETPKRAWQAVAAALGLSPAPAAAPECVYLGAPWEGVPFYAEHLATDRLTLSMSLPDGPDRDLSLRAELTPCD
jgi:hypothetical protein